MKSNSPKGAYLFYVNTYFFFYFSMGIFISILSLYLTDNGVTTTQLSFVVSATALFTIVLQPLMGLLADKYRNLIRIIAIFLCITFFTGIGFIFTKNVFVLFLLNGVTQAIILSTMTLFDNLAMHADFSYGTIRLWGSIGYAVSVQLTGIVYDYFPHNWVFVLFGITTLLSLLSLFKLKNIKYEKHQKISIKDTVQALGRSKSFILFLLLNFTILGMHYCNISYMPILVKEVGGTASTVGTILLFQTICEIPFLFFSEQIIRFITLKKGLIMVACLMTIRWFIYSLPVSTSAMIGLCFFQALTTCLFFVLSLKIVMATIDKRYANTALSLGSMVGKGLGALTFQLTGGQILSVFGSHGLYLFLAIIGVVAIVLALGFPIPVEEDIASTIAGKENYV